MKLALLGVGQAGGKILDEFLAYDARTDGSVAREAIAVNTARTDLEGLEHVPEDRRVLVGQTRVKGHGVGGDNELGAEIAEEDVTEIQRALDHVSITEVDAFVVVAALGGGTGSGGGPVIARHLSRVYSEPVYGLGVLPSSEEGAIYTLNAARSFRTFVREVDNLLLFDNDAWRQAGGTSLQESYDTINEELVTRFGVLFRAGELGEDGVAESVVDASEITNTLGCGGVSTVGYAAAELPSRARGLLARFRDGGDADFDSTSATAALVRQATRGRLTLPCDVDGAERALVVVAGPPRFLDRKGLDRARRWLEEQTGSMEVRGGDYPVADTGKLAVAVLFSGVTDVPRLQELQEVATDAQDRIRSKRRRQPRNVDDLLEGGEDLDSLL